MKQTPLVRKTTLASGGPIKRVSALKRTEMRRVVSEVIKPKRQKDTGPSPAIRNVVHERSGGRCEFPDCPERRRDVQHRLNRKSGGRHGEMRTRLNQPSWLADICGDHHHRLHRATGAELDLYKAMGWILPEFKDGEQVDAAREPILMRHWPTPILLDDEGYWTAVG